MELAGSSLVILSTAREVPKSCSRMHSAVYDALVAGMSCKKCDVIMAITTGGDHDDVLSNVEDGVQILLHTVVANN